MKRHLSAVAPPVDAVDAATHPDPYPSYAALRAGPALAFDPGLRLWVASRADVIQRLLSHPALRVRPPAEPVPRAIEGSPAGEVFARLVRMNDGPLHAAHRPVLERALPGIDLQQAHAQALQVARGLAGLPLNDAMFVMPLCALAQLLGFAPGAQAAIAAEARAFVACLSPLSTPAQLTAASEAALALRERMRSNAATQGRGGDPETELANRVGLFSQTCDATAGLIGQSLVALAREPELVGAVGARPDGFALLVQEVARHDPPVQNTWRFVAGPCTLEGVTLQPGDALLLVLAAANRDPALNPEPDRFLLDRAGRRSLGFGQGAHRCPGQALAFALAGAGVQALLEGGIDLATLACHGWRFQASVNGRLPYFLGPSSSGRRR